MFVVKLLVLSLFAAAWIFGQATHEPLLDRLQRERRWRWSALCFASGGLLLFAL